MSACTVTFTPSDGQATWIAPAGAIDVKVTVAAGSGARFVGSAGPGGPGGTVTTALDSSIYGQTLHVLAGAAGIDNASWNPPYAQGGGGSFVAVPGAFVAVAGGGGGGGMQVSSTYQDGMPLADSQGNLTGGAGGFAAATADGGRGTDSNGADSYGTGAIGATPGTGDWSAASTSTRSTVPGTSGTVAAVAPDGTITAGTGGSFTYIGQGAADGGGGYAGGGSGAFVGQDVFGPNNTETDTLTSGTGGGGSGFLAAGLTPLLIAPNTGDGYVTFTYSIAPAVRVPGAPTNLTATPDPDSGAAIIGWTDPADTGTSAITDYPLERSTDGTNWSAEGSVAGVSNGNFYDYGLKPGVTYYYRLAAENTAGVGAFSAPVSMLSQVYPGAVLNFTASSGNHLATLTWTTPTDTGGTPITGYEVQYAAMVPSDSSPSAVPGSRWVGATTTTASTYTLTGLSNNTVYGARIRSLNIQGPSREWMYTQAYPQAPQVVFSPAMTQPNGSALNGSTITPGSNILVSQSGLPAGATMTITLRGGSAAHPVSAVLGTVSAGSDGTIKMTLKIPSGLQSGNYALTAELSNAGPATVPYTAYFTVQRPVAPAGPTTGAGHAVAHTPAHTASITTGASGHANSLASTGATYGQWMVPLGSLLVLGGAGLLIMQRRRARA
ncbi:fibronectin type III domain-containing protein [Arthrobacter wenxiniae]|uniref:fibronectin type III domain-containing protein n=1 Tax=Arthrobacter wenxiniae TaxID=2713570 RepID=UPI001C3FF72D